MLPLQIKRAGCHGSTDDLQRVVRIPEVENLGAVSFSDVNESAVPIGADGGQPLRQAPSGPTIASKSDHRYIISLEFTSRMNLHVESSQGFRTGDTLSYYDVQPGDGVVVPVAWEGSP